MRPASPPDFRSAPSGCRLFLLLAALLGLTGCETTRSLSLAPSPGATALGPDRTVVEHRHRVALELRNDSFSSELANVPTFALTVQNRGDDPLELGPGHVRVFSANRAVPAYTRDAFLAAIDEAARREAEAYTGRQAEVYLQADASRVDPSSALANIEAAKRTNRAGKARARYDALRAEASQLLTPTTVSPDSSLMRLIKLDPATIKDGQPLQVLVSVDGEIYEFTVNVGGR